MTVWLTATFDSSTTPVAEAAAPPGHVISIQYVRAEKRDKRPENTHEVGFTVDKNVQGFERSSAL